MYSFNNDAEKIYFTLFNKSIPEEVYHRFQAVSKKIDNNYPHDKVVQYYELIGKTDDLEALELAARYLRKQPLLTEKFKLMVYLAEIMPDNYDVFINENPKRFIGYIKIIFTIMRTVFKLGKGLIIILFYKL